MGAQRDAPAEPGGGAVLAGALPAHGPVRLLLLQEVRLQVAGLPLWEGLAQVRRLRPLAAAPLLLVEQGEARAAKMGFRPPFDSGFWMGMVLFDGFLAFWAPRTGVSSTTTITRRCTHLLEWTS